MNIKIKIVLLLLPLLSCKMTNIKVENFNRKDFEINPKTYNINLKFDTIKSFTQFLSYTKYSYKIDSNFKVDNNDFSYWFDEATTEEKQKGQIDSNLFKKIIISDSLKNENKNLWGIYAYKLKQDSFLRTINISQFKNRKLNDSLLNTLIDTSAGYMSIIHYKKKYDYVDLIVFKTNNQAQFYHMYYKDRNQYQISQKTNCQYYINDRTKVLVLRFPTLISQDEYVYIQDWIFKIDHQSLILKCKNTFTENGPSYYLTMDNSYIKVKFN